MLGQTTIAGAAVTDCSQQSPCWSVSSAFQFFICGWSRTISTHLTEPAVPRICNSWIFSAHSISPYVYSFTNNSRYTGNLHFWGGTYMDMPWLQITLLSTCLEQFYLETGALRVRVSFCNCYITPQLISDCFDVCVPPNLIYKGKRFV